MKKFAVVSILLAGLALASCEQNRPAAPARDSSQKVILCSFLPIWAFTRNVVGDRPGVSVEVLIPGTQGPHDYQLTPGDMRTISRADLFIVNGYHLEEFLENAVKKSRPDLTIVRAGEAVKPLRVSEDAAWQLGEEDPDHHHHDDVNPHTFASPRDAATMVRFIAQALARFDPEGAETYLANGETYAKKLEALADQFREMVAKSPNPRVVTFHNAFDYLGRDSGLIIVGSIEVTPGQQPSAGDLAALVKRVRATKAVAVLSEPQFSSRLAQVVAEEAGIKLASLDPAATGELDPAYYERVMKANLETLTGLLVSAP